MNKDLITKFLAKYKNATLKRIPGTDKWVRVKNKDAIITQ